MQQQGKKNPSPRSILSFFSPGRVAEVSLSENYVSLDDETSIPWHGSSPSWPKVPAKPPAPKAKPLPKKPAPAPAPAQANWLVEKIKHLSLTGLLEKATNAECYELTKEKHIEKIVLLTKEPDTGKEIGKYFDFVLKACSKGSLTRVDHSIKIMKVCYVLHCIMKKGSALSYKHVFGNYPDIFDLPQIELPKSIPASCVEARMAISYAAFLKSRVRLRQQDTIEGSTKTKTQLFSVYGLDEKKAVDLYERGLSCRFFRKRDHSNLFPRDTIHWFQLHIISDLVGQFDRFRNELLESSASENFDEVLTKRKQQLVSWAERMQASKYLADSEYFILKGIEKSATQASVSEKSPDAEEQTPVKSVSPFKPVPDLMSF